MGLIYQWKEVQVTVIYPPLNEAPVFLIDPETGWRLKVYEDD